MKPLIAAGAERALTRAEAEAAFDILFEGDATPSQMGGLLMALRTRGETVDEFAAQTFNTEHIYPQSKLSTEDAKTDLHHLRSIDEDINSDRSNFPFAEGSGDYGLVGNQQWYPGDDWKGDVARMVFYLNIRYSENIEAVGSLDLFLKWNREDPVSEFEMQRNNVIEAAQGNRNPFIDNPYLATLIWGGEDAENRWE